MNKKKIAQAVQTAIAVGVFSSLAVSTPYAAEDKASLDKVEVTGSRIKRTEAEGASPVTVITREQIEASGEVSVADILRNTTFNSFGSYRETSGNNYQGNANLSLRGLGSQRTLILIDGRRVPPSPVQSGDGADLNTLPLAAVERIEILSDGASAIYGSDAIGGVINIITRKNYTGTEISFSTGSPSRPGADEKSSSLVTGLATDKANIIFGISTMSRDIVWDRDRPWSASSIGDGVDYNTTVGLSRFGNTFRDATTGIYEAGPGCDPSLIFTVGTTANQYCTFDFTAYSAQTAALDSANLFVKSNYEINSSNTFFVDASYAKTESFGRYAPVPDSITFAATDPIATTYFGGRAGRLDHRYEQLGPRDNVNYSDVFVAGAGVNGDAAGFDYQVGARISKYSFHEFGLNYLLRSVARQKVANLDGYDPFDPTVATQTDLDSMRVTISRDSEFFYKEIYANATTDVGSLAGGPITVAFGAEKRYDEFYDHYDSQSMAGQVGGSAGGAGGGQRDAQAIFAEAVFPVTSTLELNAAFRNDKYSDAGSETSPKISAKFQVSPSFMLRASWGQGFRAPTLNDLYGAEAYSAEFAKDLVNCAAKGFTVCPVEQFDTFFNSNPDLKPETSDTINIGLVFEPTKNLSLTVDYYDIQMENTIQGFSLQDLIDIELAGGTLPAGSEINRFATGEIWYAVTGNALNIGTIETSGLDINTRYNTSLGDMGVLGINLQLGYVNEYKTSTASMRNVVGEAGIPQIRAQLGFDWKLKDLQLAWNTNYIDSTAATTDNDAAGNVIPVGSVDAWLTHDLQVKYTLPFNGDITVGMRNVTDEDPPLNFFTDVGYDRDLYNGRGRVTYVGYTQRF